MTEKRFEYYNHKGADYILDTPNKSLDFIEMLGDCLEAEEIVDLLNGLNDENKQLQTKNNAYLQDIEVYKEDNTHLKLENDELKKILGFLQNDNATDILNVLNSQENQIWELKKEVEQLKNKIKTYNSANELLKETIDRLRNNG